LPSKTPSLVLSVFAASAPTPCVSPNLCCSSIHLLEHRAYMVPRK
jgi:hypothetical protein